MSATRDASRIASLDLLRGIAAFSVAIPHYLVLDGRYSEGAEIISILAVEVFFVMSGFVLAPQILRCMRSGRLSDLRVFLMRRWMRTIPPFTFALIVIAVLSGQLLTADFSRYLFYVQNFFGQHNHNDFFPVAWSLSIEEWFYVIFPAVVVLGARWGRRAGSRFEVAIAVGFIAVITLARTLLGNDAEWGAAVRRVVVFRVDSIAYGFLLYLAAGKPHVSEHVEIEGTGGRLWVAAAACAAALAAAAAAAWWAGVGRSTLAQHAFPFAAAGLGASAIHLFYCIGARLDRHRAYAAFGDFMGRISYSTYLFHLIVAQIVVQRMAPVPGPARFLAFLAALVAFCSLFYEYFERPILTARPRYPRR